MLGHADAEYGAGFPITGTSFLHWCWFTQVLNRVPKVQWYTGYTMPYPLGP